MLASAPSSSSSTPHTGASAVPNNSNSMTAIKNGQMPSLHLRCRLGFHTLPMGNRLPMVTSMEQLASRKFVDAHSVKDITVEKAIEGIAHAMPHAMPPEELMLRRQIASSILITMGKKITHFEGDIDPLTGTVDVDFTFAPIISEDEHLELHAYDPEDPERKVKDCAILRVYSASYDPKTGDKFSHLLGCQAIDLCSLMQHSINVSSKKVSANEFRDYDFAVRTNFCNTFVLGSVLPIGGTVCTFGSPAYENSALNATDLHVGLRIPALDAVQTSKVQAELKCMTRELDRLRSCLRAYEEAEVLHRSSPLAKESRMSISSLHVTPSILRNLPDIETVVKLQQALQQVYCAHGIETANAVLSEPNGMMYAPGGTSLQLHQARVGFADMSAINRARIAPVTRDKIMVQLFTAMVKSGLKPKDLMEMKAHAHEDDIISFLNSAIAGGQMDQMQTPYAYDMVLHSVMPVAEHIALADLRPVPGVIEYAPDCHDCFYRLHKIYSTTQKKFYEQWYCYNLAMSEDIRQLRTAYNTHTQEAMDDCENQAQQQMAYVMGMMKLKRDLANSPKATLDEFMNPHLFSGFDTSAKVDFLKGIHCLLQEVDNMHCYCNTGNAHGGQASVSGGVTQRALTGHCYTGIDYYLRASEVGSTPRVRTTLLEGTKWVKPMFATASKAAKSKICRNACLDCPTLQNVNQLASLMMELTKIPSVVPTLDLGCSELQILQDKGDNFYANVYVSDNKIIFHEAIPGVPTSPLALGAPITYVTHRVPSLRSISMKYQLATEHMRLAGYKDIRDTEIQEMVMSVAMEEAVPAWRKQEWEKYVYSRYLPCSVLYEDDTVTNSFVPGKHCAFSFTHEAAKGMDMAMAKQYADNILAIIHSGATPPITKVHAERVRTVGFPPLMPDSIKQQVRSFDHAELNSKLEGLFTTKNPGAIRVERIATSMGCLVTTCVAEVKHLAALTNGIIAWAKPIIEVNSHKANLCMEWRKTLELKQSSAQANQNGGGMDPRMQVGAMYAEEEDETMITASTTAGADLPCASETGTEDDSFANDLEKILSLKE